MEELKAKIALLTKLIDLLRKLLGLQTRVEKLKVELMVRRIAQQYGVNADILVAVLYCESGMDPKAVHRNANGSTDFGLCQFNDYWYKDIIDPLTALKVPEEAVRVMCRQWEKGRHNDWYCYRTKKYVSYLNADKQITT